MLATCEVEWHEQFPQVGDGVEVAIAHGWGRDDEEVQGVPVPGHSGYA